MRSGRTWQNNATPVTSVFGRGIMIKHRLNGWQRSWVVFCGIYFVAIVVTAIFVLPTGSEQAHKRVVDSIDLVSRYNALLQRVEAAGFSKDEIEQYLSKGGKLDNGRPVEHEPPDIIRTKYYGDLKDEEILARLHATYLKKVNFSAVEADYQKGMAQVRGDRLRLMLYAFFFWCGTSLGLYGFGFSVAWIIRGFREK
jgi:hypothetical protein